MTATKSGIIFHDWQIRALANGMTQFWVPVVPRDKTWTYSAIDDPDGIPWLYEEDEMGDSYKAPGPHEPGDEVFVKETWCALEPEHFIGNQKFAYRATCGDDGDRCRQEYIDIGFPYQWKSSAQMPKSASRYRIRIKEPVQFKQVWDITTADIASMGLNDGTFNPAMGIRWQNGMRCKFQDYWHDRYPKRPWSGNPWAFGFVFEVLT